MEGCKDQYNLADGMGSFLANFLGNKPRFVGVIIYYFYNNSF